MLDFQWSPEYSVSVSRFDREHKQLFTLANRLSSVVHEHAEPNLIAGLLDALVEQLANHAAAEEELLLSNGYRDLPQHQQEHKEILLRFRTVQKQFRAGEITLNSDVLQELRNRMIWHIFSCDDRYGSDLNRLGVY